MPYTQTTLPTWVKKLEKKYRDAWLAEFNRVYAKEGEAAAFKAANGTISKMGYDTKEDATIQGALQELIDDIDFLLQKAEIGIKGKPGSPAIRQFLKEVKSKVKTMIANIKESSLRKRAESIVAVIESLAGTFEDTTDKIRAAVKASGLFPEKIGEQYADGPYVRFMFLDRCIVSYQGKLYEIAYGITDDIITLGTPKEVVETYVIKEAEVFGGKEIDKPKTALKEAAYTITEPGHEEEFLIGDYMNLKEAVIGDDGSYLDNVILIEAGTNDDKRRHYPNKTIQEAAPKFAGLKMYLNHLTEAEERKNPIRSIKDWMSTVVESVPGMTQDGRATARAKVAVHSPWLREQLKDPIFRSHIGLSINTGGKVAVGKINGKEVQLVEEIIFARKNGPCSVDWVSEAGARGHVAQLIESARQGEKSGMEIKDLTLVQLKEQRADLIEAIKSESGTEKKTLETQLQEANKKIAEFEGKAKLQSQMTIVDAALKESKAPDAAKDRVRAHFESTIIEKDLKEAVATRLKEELDYINKLSGKGKISLGGTGESQDTSLKESMQSELDKRAGVAEKKEEQK